MKTTARLILAGAIALAVVGIAGCATTPQNSMTFFVTSVGSGKGADLGGLAGADAHCQKLAAAVGAGNRVWRAYLSQSPVAGQVNARDRIGNGPWTNAKGVIIAYNVDELHDNNNNLTKQTVLTEKGAIVPGRGDKPPNMHDAITGSDWNGRAFPAGADMTCGNYTRSGTEGAVQLGHIDRAGITDDAAGRSWNSSHPSRGGCSQDALRSTGGAGLFYCFAAQ